MSERSCRAGYAERRALFEKHFDAESRRLVYVGAAADADFWDERWSDGEPVRYGKTVPRRSLVVRETTRLLEPGSLIVEGGCGLAVDSWHLHQLGYRAVALDYAQRTLARVVRSAPEVRPLAGDVGRLPFATGAVDGYWSLGVIEHFYDGYSAIRDEMRRVIRPGGYLFLTFPVMSRLRRSKSRLGLYPAWAPSAGQRERFYQFALVADRVQRDFTSCGFELERARPFLGVSGLCEELGAGGRWLNRRLGGRSRPVRWARAGLDALTRPFSNHVQLLVLHRSAD